MTRFSFKIVAPYIAAIVIYLVVSFAYFPSVIEGKKIQQGDIISHKGMSKEIADYRDKTGDEPLWTNSMFGGMPAFQISMISKANLGRKIDRVFRLGLPAPVWQVFLVFIGFFLLLVAFGTDPWVGIVGGLAFGLSSYFYIILVAGHNSKIHAIAYMALVVAGVMLTYKKDKWLGGIIFTLFLSLELMANHLQITYYLMLLLLVYLGFEAYDSIKTKRVKEFILRSAILLGGVVIAVLMNATNLTTTYEYSKESIRGKSELSFNQENKTSGLDKDYATQWSYGLGETWSVLIPNVKGGASGLLAANEKAMKHVDRQFQQPFAQNQINHYWGDQPFTSGPVYIGAIVCFLFILGLFIVDSRLKWWLLTATILSFMLAWGKNMMWFTDIMLNYFPGYNKFRAVSMTMIIAEFTMPLLAFLAVKELLDKPDILKSHRRAFPAALLLTGGVALVFAALPTTFFSFFSQQETSMFASLSDDYRVFIDNIEQARIAIFRADALRTLIFVGLGAGLVYLFSIKKINKTVFLILLGGFILMDMVPVDKRYLNSDNFVSKREIKNPIPLTNASKSILKDKDIYRVLNLNNPFNESHTSFYHQSIGGYHGAKLRRYQELIDYHLTPEIERFTEILSKQPNSLAVSVAMDEMKVLNMLNARYIIYNPATEALPNIHALGNAWPVTRVRMVDNANQEITEMNRFDPEYEVIVDKRFADMLSSYKQGMDTTASIVLSSYEPNYLVYNYECSREQLYVFSEIYYDKGWKAYVDGQEHPYFRANYVLRAMVLPSGSHQVEFRFDPPSYRLGETMARIGSLSLIVLIIGYGFFVYRKRKDRAA